MATVTEYLLCLAIYLCISQSIVAVFACPWAFFKFTTSKYLQLLTNTTRNIGKLRKATKCIVYSHVAYVHLMIFYCDTAYGFMIGICIAMLVMGQRANPPPPLAGFTHLPALFGIGTYIFKTQYCLPSLITPMKNKQRVLLMMSSTMIIILAFHLFVSFTAVFWLSFDELQDLYTLNFFIPFSTSYRLGKMVLSIIGYYIVVYPVFALTPIVPVETIVLCENLKALVRLLFREKWIEIKPLMFTIDRIVLPMIVILLPLSIAFATTNVDFVLGVSAGVFGVWIQYLISTALLFAGKRFLKKKYKYAGKYENKYKSPFSHVFFLIFITVWTVASVILVITGHILALL